jgi:hypothetical protein
MFPQGPRPLERKFAMPDVIFEVFTSFEPSADETANIQGFLQKGLSLAVPLPKALSVWNPDKQVLTLGFWIDPQNVYTDDQLKESLRERTSLIRTKKGWEAIWRTVGQASF